MRRMNAACAIRAAGLILAFGLAWPAIAGPREDADAAYSRQDYATTLRLLKPLADQGDADAQNLLGLMYGNGQGVPKDDAQAVKWYRLAADQGGALAQVSLGLMYAEGQGVPKDDAQAVKWYRLAADQGDAMAQVNLGTMYAKGEGVLRDYVLAYMWSNFGAARGNELGRKNRDVIAPHMTLADISEAQRLSREWKPK
jgi:TPR repeat protein